jgi:hypothetical protein
MIQERYTHCLRSCELCADACNHCAVSCLGEEGVAHLRRCIVLDLECAAVCRLTADSLGLDGEHLCDVLDLCSRICLACHKECLQHEHNHCQACAVACQQCAEDCRVLSEMLAAEGATSAHA